MTKNDLKGLETKELIKCDGCGGYHTLDESEVIIIKYIKGKNCEFKPQGHVTEKIVYVDNTPKKDTREDIKPAGERVELSEQEKKPIKIRAIMPAEFSGMNIPPDHQAFETRGAKISRVA